MLSALAQRVRTLAQHRGRHDREQHLVRLDIGQQRWHAVDHLIELAQWNDVGTDGRCGLGERRVALVAVERCADAIAQLLRRHGSRIGRRHPHDDTRRQSKEILVCRRFSQRRVPCRETVSEEGVKVGHMCACGAREQQANGADVGLWAVYRIQQQQQQQQQRQDKNMNKHRWTSTRALTEIQ